MFRVSIAIFSLLVPLILYLVLFVLVFQFSLPLKSEDTGSGSSAGVLDKYLERTKRKPRDMRQVLSTNEDFFNGTVPPIQLLTDIFLKADLNYDGYLTVNELTDFIHTRTNAHIETAMADNLKHFKRIDIAPKDEVITWNEYHTYFLEKHGVDDDYIRNHDAKHPGLGRPLKEVIARDRASWYEAARTDPEFLTLEEFLAFRHPESSDATLLSLVDDLMDKLDRDGDELLTEEEFAVLQFSGGETLISQGEDHRRREFNEIIDLDKNNLADRKELLKYIDPRNPRHAKEESLTLMTLGDEDKDGKLTLEEVLSKMDLFLGSKMVNTARNFHDEF